MHMPRLDSEPYVSVDDEPPKQGKQKRQRRRRVSAEMIENDHHVELPLPMLPTGSPSNIAVPVWYSYDEIDAQKDQQPQPVSANNVHLPPIPIIKVQLSPLIDGVIVDARTGQVLKYVVNQKHAPPPAYVAD